MCFTKPLQKRIIASDIKSEFPKKLTEITMTNEERTQYIMDNYDKLIPMFGGFIGKPVYISLSSRPANNSFGQSFENQRKLQQKIEQYQSIHGATWSFSNYLEYRGALEIYPQMRENQRYYHMGLDINGPVGTTIYAPWDATVVESHYEPKPGNYGGLTILRPDDQDIYILFGHLAKDHLPEAGQKIKKDEAFARFGNETENGNWYPHVHIQAITEKGWNSNWALKGYCTEFDLENLEEYTPDPIDFLL